MGGATQFRRARPPPARHHVHRRRPRDDRRLGRGRLDDHRDRCRQGALRRGPRRVPDTGQPAGRDPAVHRRPHRHHQRDGQRRATDRVRAAGIPRVRGRHGPGRPQRALRRRVPPALQPRSGPAVAAVRGARHRQARAPGHHPRRRTQLQALVAGPRLQLLDHAQPPRPRRRARHGRRPPRPHGAARRARGPHPRGAADLQLPGQRRPAQEAPPRRVAAALPRRLPVQGRPGPRALRRHLARPAQPRAHLLHRLRDPVADGRDGQPRVHGHRHRVRDTPRGRGARAAADRRAQAEVQPPLPVPREGPLRQAHPRGMATALPGPPGARRRRRLPRPLRVAQDGREVPGRAARDVPGAPVLRQAPTLPHAGHALGLRAGRDGTLPLALRRQRRPHDLRRSSCANCATRCCNDPTRWSRPSTGG